MVVRVAGLPADLMEGFRSELADKEITSRANIEHAISLQRTALVAALHEEIRESPANQRRFLLSAKRDCFNGRSIHLYMEDPRWRHVSPSVSSGAIHLHELEDQLDKKRLEFGFLFKSAHDAERSLLLTIINEPSLLRGIALASPQLALYVNSQKHQTARPARKIVKEGVSILRYVSRCTMKLSPFSTLTRLGIGVTQNAAMDSPVQLLDKNWHIRSLFRFKRHVITSLYELLLSEKELRRQAAVRVNQTLEQIGQHQYRWLQPTRFSINHETEQLTASQEALVRAQIRGKLAPALLAWNAGELNTYSELVEVIRGQFGSTHTVTAIEAALDEFIEMGLLEFVVPWNLEDAVAEDILLNFLEANPSVDLAMKVATHLRTAIELRNSYKETPNPGSSLQTIDENLGHCFTSTIRSKADSNISPERFSFTETLYEDVFLSNSNRPHQGEILELSATSANKILRCIRPLVWITSLFNYRLDVLLTIKAAAISQFPARSEIGFLDFFSCVQPIWKEFITFMGERPPGAWRPAFNPLSLASVRDLESLREEVLSKTHESMQPSSQGQELVQERLNEISYLIPPSHRGLSGACLFLQKAELGDLWVLNRMGEGTGRFGSRFTLVMEDRIAQQYTDNLVHCSRSNTSGCVVELVDVPISKWNNLNTHRIQTRRVLELPGEWVDIEPDRKLYPRHLRVSLIAPLPRLLDLEQVEILPVHLGTMNLRVMNPLLRFLALFGPGEAVFFIPETRPEKHLDYEVFDRLSLGNVVLRRKRWVTNKTLILQIADRTVPERFLELNKWRTARGIPDRVFLVEKIESGISNGRDYYRKPQYIDFTSPSFVELFFFIVKQHPDVISLEEMLPLQEAFPKDANGTTWATEIQLDSLGLYPSHSLHEQNDCD